MSWRKTITTDTPQETSPETAGWKSSIKSDTPEEVGALEGFGSGLQSGTALGFRDELAGLAGALGGKFGGDARSFDEIYEEAKAEELANEAKIAEAAPTASLIGTGLGAALPSLLMAPANLVKGASLGTKALQAAKFGAQSGGVIGGIQGLGESESDSVLDIAKDTGAGLLQGAGLGALFGGATPLVVEGLVPGAVNAVKGAGRLAKKAAGFSDFTSDIAASVDEGLQGKLSFGEGARRRVEAEVIDAQKQAEKQLQRALKDAGEAKNLVLKTGEELGESVDPRRIYTEAMVENIQDMGPSRPEKLAASNLAEELQNLIEETNQSGTNLTAIDRQKRSLQRMSKMGKMQDAFPQSPETSRILERTSSKVKDALEAPFEEATGENVLRQANARFKAGKEAEELLPSISEVSRLSKDFQPELRNKFEQFGALLNKADPQAAVDAAIAGTKTGADKLTSAAANFERVRRLSKGGIGGMEQIWGAVSTLPAKTANLASMGINKATTTLTDAVSALGNIPRDVVLKTADWYAEKGLPGVSQLIRQVASTEGNAKNAALFMLSQNPDFKKTIFGEDDKE